MKMERQIWEQWITIDNYRNYPLLTKVLTDFAGDNILGYVYIDHSEGITLDVLKLFNRNNGKIEFVDDPLEKKIRIIVRQAQFINTDYSIIEAKHFNDFELFKPQYLKLYEKENLTDFRKNEMFDVYRADGFPDDIQILLVTDDDKMKPELVWGRVENYNNTDNIGNCHLLVQPHQAFGININDNLNFSLLEVGNKMWVLGILDEKTKQKTEKKPWWKKW